MKHITIHEVIDAKCVKDYVVEFVFDDLRRAQVDLKRYLGKGLFKELLQNEKFKKFKVDAELGTICWSNGADLAPETLYEDAFGS